LRPQAQIKFNRFSGGMYGGKTLLAERAWILAACGGQNLREAKCNPHCLKRLRLFRQKLYLPSSSA
jgi:hypothetical protein